MKNKDNSMTFGEALEALKAGKKVARRGWNGKGMYVFLADEGCDFHTKAEIGPERSVCVHPFIVMRTAHGDFQPGWLASQSDMLLDDWEVVGERQAENVDEQGGDDGPDREDDENEAEALARSLGAMLAPHVVLGLGQRKLPEIHVNIWSLGK